VNPADGEVVLRVPARAEHLALVRLVVTSLAETCGHLGGNRLDDLRLAVSEACANAVEAYGRIGRPGAQVVVRCRARPGRIEVDVHDDAGGFDPTRLEPPPPAHTPERLHHERGLGVPLMKELAGAEFPTDGDGTTVHLVVA
jgi:anti-sigma regulatory factor (Ser/Thr protein kinase)